MPLKKRNAARAAGRRARQVPDLRSDYQRLNATFSVAFSYRNKKITDHWLPRQPTAAERKQFESEFRRAATIFFVQAFRAFGVPAVAVEVLE